jgi:predicted methyltransferase
MRASLMGSLALAAVFAAACQTEADTSVAMTSTAAPAAPAQPAPPAAPAAPAATATAASAHISAAVADAARPQADKDLDAARKPADMMAFAEVQPGDKVGELIPGGGYMTRVLAKSVGPTGKVYLLSGPPRQAGAAQPFQGILDDKANYANVSFVQTDFVTLTAPEPLDLVWTSQNYHDLHNPGRNIDIGAANKAVFNALKPGGIYVVLDHSSKAGVDFDAQLHRIDAQKVKNEVLAAGFEFVGESDVLRNPADPRDKGVFDPSIRRKTDQFILKFRKPA